MKPVISIGIQDFEFLRNNKCFYIDKTMFIKEWWESQDAVTLITRPRRFGKTLTMSMLEQFFSVNYAGRSALFEGLRIWDDEEYRSLQGTYPVISLTFANVKEKSYEMTVSRICQFLKELYEQNAFLRNCEQLSDAEKEYFEHMASDMPEQEAPLVLYKLSDFLYRYYGKKVIILLDEYDTPLQEAYVNGYWDELTFFIRSLFNATFKTNPYLERGLMTGITRVSKESIFSDLNNIEVVTTTSEKYATAFGFTEEEVICALDEFGLSDNLEKVKYWYDGFCFGSRKDIYNPWSITKYLDSGKFSTYWVNTSSNSLLGELIREGSPNIKIAVEDLLAGKQIATTLDEEIVFSQLDDNETAIWSLLLASGYLRVDAVLNDEEEEEASYYLSLTNLEVRKEFRKMIRNWFQKGTTRYNDFIKALLAGDVDYMNQYMNQVALQTFSFFDAGKQASEQAEPERFYHGFVLGLIVDLADQYRVTSNRESGLGRYDVVMEPMKEGLQAIVIEFKVFNSRREKDLGETAQNALAQIESMKYDAGLAAKGISEERICHYGFAFEGKTVLIKGE